MGKRSISELNGTNLSQSLSLIRGQDVISDLVRMILSRSSRNMKIRTEHFHSVLQASNKKGSTKEWIAAARSELELIYGLTLNNFGNEFTLLSNLERHSKDLLNILCDFKISEENNRADLKDNLYLMPKFSRSGTVVSTPDQVTGGFSLLVIAVIVLCQNKVSEADLLGYLSEFGASANLNINLPVFNKPAQIVLSELTKRDYLKRSLHGCEQTGAVVEFSLGERCKREFHPQAIHDLISDICRDEDKTEEIQRSIEKCFSKCGAESQQLA